MDYTQNLHLPQWEETDRIHHDDFNDAFAAIDAAVPRIVTGSYTGTGDTQVIEVGFTPAAVIIFTLDGTSNSSSHTYGGLFGANTPLRCNANTQTAAEITENGFRVYGPGVYSNTSVSNIKYHYLAMKF